MRIGVFDSGIGGLTVLKTLLAKYPNNEYIYYGDTLNIPYGDKTKDELLALASDNVNFLLSKKVEMIIIACGTVSANCLDMLKKKYNIPIIGVLDPTFNYLNTHNYQNILVIATLATINSHIFSKNVHKHIYELATPKLVPLIENDNYEDIDDILHGYLDDYKDKCDALVLGCTHYPIIKDSIAKIVNYPILDMSDYLVIPDDGNKGIEVYFSKLNDKIIRNTKKILDNDDIVIKSK